MKGSETSDMTSEGLGKMFEGDSSDMCAGKFPLVLYSNLLITLNLMLNRLKIAAMLRKPVDC